MAKRTETHKTTRNGLRGKLKETAENLSGDPDVGKPQAIMIRQPDLRRMIVTIRGLSPLIVSNPAPYLDDIGPNAPKGGVLKAKEVTPDQAYLASRYLKDETTHGFPVSAVKRAMEHAVGALRTGKATTLAQKGFKGMVQVMTIDGHRLAELKFKHVGPHHDVARNTRGIPLPVTRAMYQDWQMTFVVSFSADVISPATVLNLLMQAGTLAGLGVKRPAVGHGNGMFEVVESKAKTKNRNTPRAA